MQPNNVAHLMPPIFPLIQILKHKLFLLRHNISLIPIEIGFNLNNRVTLSGVQEGENTQVGRPEGTTGQN